MQEFVFFLSISRIYYIYLHDMAKGNDSGLLRHSCDARGKPRRDIIICFIIKLTTQVMVLNHIKFTLYSKIQTFPNHLKIIF